LNGPSYPIVPTSQRSFSPGRIQLVIHFRGHLEMHIPRATIGPFILNVLFLLMWLHVHTVHHEQVNVKRYFKDIFPLKYPILTLQATMTKGYFC
jgi:hypothetical protein